MPKYGGIHGQVDAARLEELIEMFDKLSAFEERLTVLLAHGNMFGFMNLREDMNEYLALKQISYPYWLQQLEAWEKESD